MSQAPLTGTTLDGKYAVLKQLGEGGMGAVYLARHLGTSRLVALKVIVPGKTSNEDFVERFRREAEAAGSLRHPNVVDVTDFGFADVDGDRIAYLVMEYLDGCSLAEILDEEKSLALEWAVDILAQACSAVDEAHRRGIVHRDLKPHNIWLEPNRRGGFTVKVLDFGLAKIHEASARGDEQDGEPPRAQRAITGPLAPPDGPDVVPQEAVAGGPAGAQAAGAAPALEEADDQRSLSAPRDYRSLTKVGTIVGTPYYMSPEQCRGLALDARSDVYSLGVIAYELLAGQRPFPGPVMEVIANQVLATPRHVSDVAPAIPRRVGDVVMGALAKQPDARPPGAMVFARALRAHAEGFGAVVRHAVTLCTQNFPAFLRLFAVAFGPLVALRVVNFVAGAASGWVPPAAARAWEVGFGVVAIGVASFVAAAVSRGVAALLLAQTEVAPLRKASLRAARGVLRKRLGALVTGSVAYLAVVGLPLAIFLVALRGVATNATMGFTNGVDLGRELIALAELVVAVVAGYVTFRNFTTFSLFPIALLLEGKGVRDGLARSRELVSRGRHNVIPVAAVEIGGFVLEMLVGVLVMRATSMWLVNALSTLAIDTGIELLLSPIEAVAYAVVYLKLRQMGGESVEEILGDQLAEQEIPKTRWMQRMRKRAASGVSGI